MTDLEQKARTLVDLIGDFGYKNEQINVALRALKEVRREALEECKKELCPWCERDIPIVSNEGTSFVWFHKVGENIVDCDADALRALADKENSDG